MKETNRSPFLPRPRVRVRPAYRAPIHNSKGIFTYFDLYKDYHSKQELAEFKKLRVSIVPLPANAAIAPLMMDTTNRDRAPDDS